jgi:Sensors of blue-light using FAD
MYLLVYVSSAASLFSEEELMDLLKKAREKNRTLDITGMLLYKDGNFMQLLEGPKDAVLALVAKIKLDPRHRGFIALLQEERIEREFSGWEMGFQKLDDRTSLEIPGYSHFFDLPLSSEEFLQSPSKALKLLLNFKKTMR